jgi:hypothetical protein
VARSAPIPVSSCPVDRKPLAARGSRNIWRSFRFWFHSFIVFQTICIVHGLTLSPYLMFLSRPRAGSVEGQKFMTLLPYVGTRARNTNAQP